MKFFVFLVALNLFADSIFIVDCGSQTAHLIARRLRQVGVTTKIVGPEESAFKNAAGIILSGGPASVYEEGAPRPSAAIFEKGVPVLGICYGWQYMAHVLGGKVDAVRKEYGLEEVSLKDNVFRLPASSFQAVMSHGDSVVKLPPGFVPIARTASAPVVAAIDQDKKWLGLQFHPEAEHTVFGQDILKYFAADLCGLTLQPMLLDPGALVDSIRKQVGDQGDVICAVSGGVDSTTAAFFIAKAIGKRMHAIYIDTQLMRAGTKEQVQEIFSHIPDANLQVIDANERFLTALQGVSDPEAKRKIIGKLYVDLFQEAALALPNVRFLAQGTIYSDVIESKGSTLASKIKSHHNVGGLPASLKLALLEPLREFYKDEVRTLGRMSNLPKEFIDVHPFPGPGYAVRIRGEVTQKRLSQLRQADAIILEELRQANLYDKVFQCFAVMTGAYSTAVKGDGRAFEEVVAIRAYESSDVMTASWARLPYPLLDAISRRIVNEVPNISRVVYDITGKPPATMEWE